MNTLNLKLPEIIFTDNFSHAISNKVKKSNCIIFTSKYWAKKSYYKSLKKKTFHDQVIFTKKKSYFI